MAEDVEAVQKSAYPVIPRNHWWGLRDKFKKSIPNTVDAKYVSTSLAMAEASARSNIIPSLKAVGLIGEDLKPTPLATRWRDDVQYPEVCAEIVRKVYPQGLRDVASDPVEDVDAARRWFSSHGSGEALVNKLVSVYTLLLEADVSKAKDTSKREVGGTPKPKTQRAKIPAPAGVVDPAPSVEKAPPAPHEEHRRKINVGGSAALHLNVQIHISPEVSADQIDQIFASMAKHLKSLSE